MQLHHDDEEFKPVVESLTRIDNILKKAKFKGNVEVDESLFEDNSEKELYVGVQNLQEIESLADLYQGFVQLQPVIDQYFDVNMIMDKNEKVKNNRLAQLYAVSELADRLGNLSKLVIK